MQYNEDRWNVQINPINIRYKNEPEWKVPPIVTTNSPNPEQQLTAKGNSLYINENLIQDENLFPDILNNQGYINKNQLDTTTWNSTNQVKLRDKYLKVRIRYSGKELAIIQAVQTLFRISYA